MTTKIYLVYNQWQMDSETWIIEMGKAFSSKEAADEHKEKLEKESNDKNDNFMIEEVDFGGLCVISEFYLPFSFILFSGFILPTTKTTNANRCTAT